MKTLVTILSGKNYKETKNRVVKGIYFALTNEINDVTLLFNGFNTAKEHDEGFIGDWQNDERLSPYSESLDMIKSRGVKVEIVYARNTAENAAKTLEEELKNKYEKILVITDDWHIPRASLCFYAFFGSKYNEKIDFIAVRNSLKKKVINTIKQLPYFLASYYCLLKVKKKKPETVESYNRRWNLVKKILKF